MNLGYFDEMNQRNNDLDKLNYVAHDLVNSYDDFANTLNLDIDQQDNMT
jgi:hypothetical protein